MNNPSNQYSCSYSTDTHYCARERGHMGDHLLYRKLISGLLLTDLTHTRSCPSLTPGHEEDCTCGLVWRIRLRNEMEQNAPWKERARKAEEESQQLRTELYGCSKVLEDIRTKVETVTEYNPEIRAIAFDFMSSLGLRLPEYRSIEWTGEHAERLIKIIVHIVNKYRLGDPVRKLSTEEALRWAQQHDDAPLYNQITNTKPHSEDI